MEEIINKNKRILIGKNEREIIYLKSGKKCFYCGKKLKKDEATIEHIIPLDLGGLNDIKNMVCACEKCNHEKGNSILYKHIIAMENHIEKQNEVLESKKKLADKLLALFEEELGKKPKNKNKGNVNNEQFKMELNKKDQEINALKSERAKLLKDINKMKDQEGTLVIKEKQETEKVREQLNGVRTAYKKLQNDYKILEKELEENKNKAQVVVKKEEYEIRLKELTEKNKALNDQLNKRKQ